MDKFGWTIIHNGQKIDSSQKHALKLKMVITFENAHVVLGCVTIIVYILSHSCLLPQKTKFFTKFFLPQKQVVIAFTVPHPS